jgi:hypothetical protein
VRDRINVEGLSMSTPTTGLTNLEYSDVLPDAADLHSLRNDLITVVADILSKRGRVADQPENTKMFHHRFSTQMAQKSKLASTYK